MENVKRKVLIIGGGASGLMAAIMAAREGAEVTILEHMDRVGKKILSTGNGRCNLTNLSLKPEHYRSSQKLFPMKVLDRFSVWDTLSFFDGIGIITRNRNGYIYPNSDQAASVLDALRFETEHLGIKTVLSCQIRSAKKTKNGSFLVESDQGTYQGDCLILATGSKAASVSGSDGSGYELAKAFGHTIIKPLPALVLSPLLLLLCLAIKLDTSMTTMMAVVMLVGVERFSNSWRESAVRLWYGL